MGFLEGGIPLDWEETSALKQQIKNDGLSQLLNIFKINKDRQDLELFWGDELEFMIIHLDHKNKKPRLCVNAPSFIDTLLQKERHHDWPPHLKEYGAIWHPEFGTHMIEATPDPPYKFSGDSVVEVEASMAARREKVQCILPENVYVCSLTTFPRLGLIDSLFSLEENLTKMSPSPTPVPLISMMHIPRATRDRLVMNVPPLRVGLKPYHLNLSKDEHRLPLSRRSCGNSNFYPDILISPHPRFPTLLQNMCQRRQRPAVILLPVYKDKYTDQHKCWSNAIKLDQQPKNGSIDLPALTCRKISERSLLTTDPVKDNVFMDHLGFGMGMCCLQTTFGAPNLRAARNLFDQLAVLAPFFLALSAAAPVHRGLLTDTDTRWSVIEQACDCRTDQERAYLKRSRYSPVTVFLGDNPYFHQYAHKLNDLDIPMENGVLERLMEGGMDFELARHFSSLWVRDPLCVFSHRIHIPNNISTDHFENLQSTNWQSIRFKPPSATPEGTPAKIGWRVELRTIERQASDFDNAAFAVLSFLLAAAVYHEKWSFYMPMSMVHSNMEAAKRRSAIQQELFYFPTNIKSTAPPGQDCAFMSIGEIFLGSTRTGFKGILRHLEDFVQRQPLSFNSEAREKISQYLRFFKNRILQEIPTDAATIRHIVQTHHTYQRDSHVNDTISYDICQWALSAGQEAAPKSKGT